MDEFAINTDIYRSFDPDKYIRYMKLNGELPGLVVNDRYTLGKRLGCGGFGIVFAARDTKEDVTVAIKFLNPDLTYYSDRFARVKKEIAIAQKIDDGRIIKIISLDRWQGIYFMVMEQVCGENLQTILLREQRFAWQDFSPLFWEILQAVKILHHAGIIHRDLKPSNIIVTPDRAVKILDFGLAMDIADDIAGPPERDVLGSPHYLSPEQIHGLAIDARSDIYQLGLILFRALTGRHPFEKASTLELVHCHLHEKPPHPQSLVTQLPSHISAIILKALGKKPKNRFANIDELIAAVSATHDAGHHFWAAWRAHWKKWRAFGKGTD